MKTIHYTLLLLVLFASNTLLAQKEIATSSPSTSPDPQKEVSIKKNTTIDVSSEIVSDFIWRGMSFSGEAYNWTYPLF